MDFQRTVDEFEGVTCIISVEKKPDGSCGEIRIKAGNKPFVKNIETPYPGAPKIVFVPDSPYMTFLPKDLNFEDMVYRSAILKQPRHTYVHPERYDFWFNIYTMPLASDDENIGYCTYTMEFTKEADMDAMSNRSNETAAGVLRACLKLRATDDFDKNLNDVCEDIRKMCDATCCAVMLVDFDENTSQINAEKFKEGSSVGSIKKYVDIHPEAGIQLAKAWLKLIEGSDALIIKNKSDMDYIKSKYPEWIEQLEKSNIESVVLFPLSYDRQILGFFWVTNFDTEKTVKIRETLEITTFFLASEVSNRRLMKRLEVMSTIDLLTGAFNRNAMNDRVMQLTGGDMAYPDTIGIVYADMNGLKEVNDNEGHHAGDRMLQSMARILQNVFKGFDVYRVGGDEFVILAENISAQEFDERLQKLHEAADSSDSVRFAIGSTYYDRERDDIRTAMHSADENMYTDKANYYRSHPESNRRQS